LLAHRARVQALPCSARQETYVEVNRGDRF